MLKVPEKFLNLTIGSCNEIWKISSFLVSFNLTNLDDIFVIFSNGEKLRNESKSLHFIEVGKERLQ
jgi:hypothetical protein